MIFGEPQDGRELQKGFLGASGAGCNFWFMASFVRALYIICVC